MNAGLIKFLLVVVALLSLAVYYHYEGPQVEFSRTLFGASHGETWHQTLLAEPVIQGARIHG